MDWGSELNKREKAGLPCLPLAMLLVHWHSLESSPDPCLSDHTISTFPRLAGVTACATAKPDEFSRSPPTHTVPILLSLAIVKQLVHHPPQVITLDPSNPIPSPHSQKVQQVSVQPGEWTRHTPAILTLPGLFQMCTLHTGPGRPARSHTGPDRPARRYTGPDRPARSHMFLSCHRSTITPHSLIKNQHYLKDWPETAQWNYQTGPLCG